MKEYIVTLRNENGPYFSIYADNFKISYNSYTHKPQALMFECNGNLVSYIMCYQIFKLQRVDDSTSANIATYCDDFKGYVYD